VRIASLLPSATEIVCALGLGDALVARSHECDFPAGVDRLPAVTRARIDVAGSSREIHDRVTEVSLSADGVYAIDRRRLRELAPTHVITQAQCDVCAVSLDDVENALRDWGSDPPRLMALHPSGLESVFEDIRTAGDFLAARGKADAVEASMRERMESVCRMATISTSGTPTPRPRVAAIEWLDPPMAAGNWIPELIELAGGDPVVGFRGRHSAWLSPEDLAAADPDILIAMPCGFDLGRTSAELVGVLARPFWGSLRAVRSGRIAACDGNAFFNRPGPRLSESVEILAEILDPGRFPPLHRGTAWETAGVPR